METCLTIVETQDWSSVAVYSCLLGQLSNCQEEIASGCIISTSASQFLVWKSRWLWLSSEPGAVTALRGTGLDTE